MISLLYLVPLLLWAGGSVVRTALPNWLFPLVFALHLLAGLAVLAAHRRDLTRRRSGVRSLGLLGLLVLPPLAPVAICHLLSGVTRRAGRRRGAVDPLGSDLLRVARSWWVMSHLGVVLLVVWCQGPGLALLDPPAGAGVSPLVDPLQVPGEVLGPLPRLGFLLLTLRYAWLFRLTTRLLAADRQSAPASDGTVPSPDEPRSAQGASQGGEGH